jgi:hypothetical protein
MRFYSGQHRFYCGVDRPTRRNVFGPAADTTAEIADRNQSGVSGAITGLVTVQQSLRDLRALSASSTPIDFGGHKRVRPRLVLSSHECRFLLVRYQSG